MLKNILPPTLNSNIAQTGLVPLFGNLNLLHWLLTFPSSHLSGLPYMLKNLWATFVDLTYAWSRCWTSCLDHLLSILQSDLEDTIHFPYGTLQPITLPVSGLAMKAARFLALSLSLSLFASCSFKPITTYIYTCYLYRHTSVQYNAVYGCSLITKLVSLIW